MNGDIEELKRRVAKLEEHRAKPSSKIPEASLLIFLVTALGYLLIFWYERGWCSYFNIPPAFIHPDLFTMLGCGIGGILVLALLLLVFGYFLHYEQTNWKAIKWIALIGSIAILAIDIGIRNREDITIAVSVVLWWLLVPLPHLRKVKQEHKYIDWLKAFTTKYKLTVTIPLSIGLLYVLCGVAYCYGWFNGSIAKEFFCRNSPRREVVLRVYGSTAITAPIVNTTNVSPDFSFIKMEGESNVFTLTNIGKLTPLPIKPQPQPAQDKAQQSPTKPNIPTNQMRANQTVTNSAH